jgi:hypothetical protein
MGWFLGRGFIWAVDLLRALFYCGWARDVAPPGHPVIGHAMLASAVRGQQIVT